jgi:large subunit ribosomal protein L3
MKCLITKKIGMTTIYSETAASNVTLLEALPNEVIAERTVENDGYNAVQIGLPKEGKDAKKKEYEVINEFRTEKNGIFEAGAVLTVGQFEKDEKVVVQGVNKGKGYQGVVKRHGFKGSPASHGHRHDLRAPGSIGSAFPERVMKGKKMSGRMGANKKTVENLKVVLADEERNVLAVKGAVPGTTGAIIKVFKR